MTMARVGTRDDRLCAVAVIDDIFVVIGVCDLYRDFIISAGIKFESWFDVGKDRDLDRICFPLPGNTAEYHMKPESTYRVISKNARHLDIVVGYACSVGVHVALPASLKQRDFNGQVLASHTLTHLELSALTHEWLCLPVEAYNSQA